MPHTDTMEPRIIPEPSTSFTQDIDPDAIKVLYRLHRSGFTGYLVGGGVRDLLLGRAPKDFDVGTSATPSQVRKLFRNCWLIGRRFRLAHIHFRGGKVIEVSTFQITERTEEDNPEELLVRRDNTFGTAGRRFAAPRLHHQRAVLRHRHLLDHRLRRRHGRRPEPHSCAPSETRTSASTRDSICMISRHALKFAARLDFDIEDETWDALVHHRMEVLKGPPSRVLARKIGRLMEGGAARRSFELLAQSGFLPILLPTVTPTSIRTVAIGRCAARRRDACGGPPWRRMPREVPPEVIPVAERSVVIWCAATICLGLAGRGRRAGGALPPGAVCGAGLPAAGSRPRRSPETGASTKWSGSPRIFSSPRISARSSPARTASRSRRSLLGARRLTRRRRKGPPGHHAQAVLCRRFAVPGDPGPATGENGMRPSAGGNASTSRSAVSNRPDRSASTTRILEDFEPVDRHAEAPGSSAGNTTAGGRGGCPAPPDERVDGRGRAGLAEEPRQRRGMGPSLG